MFQRTCKPPSEYRPQWMPYRVRPKDVVWVCDYFHRIRTAAFARMPKHPPCRFGRRPEENRTAVLNGFASDRCHDAGMPRVLAWTGVVGQPKEAHVRATGWLSLRVKLRHISDTREHRHAPKDREVTRPERVWELAIGPDLPVRRSVKVLRAIDEQVHTEYSSVPAPAELRQFEPIQTTKAGGSPSFISIKRNVSESPTSSQKQMVIRKGKSNKRVSPLRKVARSPRSLPTTRPKTR